MNTPGSTNSDLGKFHSCMLCVYKVSGYNCNLAAIENES